MLIKQSIIGTKQWDNEAMNNTYEVEVKCLLGGKDGADSLLVRMKEKDPGLKQTSFHRQLNHYFAGGNLQQLFEKANQFIDESRKDSFEQITRKATDYSVRTRDADGKVLLVIKASVDEGTSANTVARIEFEAETLKLTMEGLDQLVLKSGFEYQAKWSRERSEYKYLGINVTIDKNAGYGYLAEFEKVINDETKVAEAKSQLRELIAKLNLEELPQYRLERMFAFYNANWQDYYGTDKVFVVR